MSTFVSPLWASCQTERTTLCPWRRFKVRFTLKLWFGLHSKPRYDFQVCLFAMELTPLWTMQASASIPMEKEPGSSLCLAYPYDPQKKDLQICPSLLHAMLELQHRINAAKHQMISEPCALGKVIALSLGLCCLSTPTTWRFSSNVVSVLPCFKECSRALKELVINWDKVIRARMRKFLRYSIGQKMWFLYKISINQIFMLCAYRLKRYN